jgi:putative membrane protein
MKTPNLIKLRGVAVLAAALLALDVSAADPVTRSDGRPALKHVDQNFLEKAAKANLEEVEISRVVVERTSNPKVREFAQMIVSDHESAYDALTTIAADRGVTLPAKDTEANRWSKKDSKDFDRDYINKMVSAHEDAVKLFQKEATDGEDAESVAYARKVLPKLQHHLEQANDLKRLMK